MGKNYPPGPQGPGITMRELSGSRPIEPIGTGVAAFIGVAPSPQAHQDEVVAVYSWSHFYSPDDPEAFFPAKIVREGQETAAPWTDLAHAVYGFFLNGGEHCYVVNIGTTDGQPLTLDKSNRQEAIDGGLEMLASVDGIAMVAAPGYTGLDHDKALKAHCESCQDRLAILDPDMAVLKAQLEDEVQAPVTSKDGYLTLYFPWIRVGDLTQSGGSVLVPPSGYVAGVWARTDAARGVHKAPANEILRGALDLAYDVSDAEQNRLNAAGINAIRAFRGQGIKVWGARTLGSDDRWRYINVRRLATMLILSIARGTRWIIHEPPGETLWQSVQRSVRTFLTGYQRQGALAGSKPEGAFFVKCDEENNPPEDHHKGRVVIDIGLAGGNLAGGDTAGFQIVRIIQSETGTEIQWP